MVSFVPAGSKPALRPGVRAGEWLFLSGQVGQVDYTLVEGGVEAQLRQAMENLRELVIRHGGQMSDVVKVNIYLADIEDFWVANNIYLEYVDPDYLPARTAIAAAGLPFGALVEVEGMAYLGR